MKIYNVIIVLAICLTLTLGFFFLRPKPMRMRDLDIFTGRIVLTDMSHYLEEYYGNAENTGEEITDVNIATYLSNRSSSFSVKAATPSQYYVGVFLFPPTELQSDIPLIIAYTTSIESDNGVPYSLVLFLYGTDMTAIEIHSAYFQHVIGVHNTKMPDLYFKIPQR